MTAPIIDKLEALGITPFAHEEFSPASPSEIRQLESQLGITLPSSYCTFLMHYGESTFSKDAILEKDHAVYRIGYLYGIDSLQQTIEFPPDELPTYLIPIGEEGLGNLYCVGVSKPMFGQIFYWDHEIGLGFEAEQYLEKGINIPDHVKLSCLFLLSESFEAFVTSLHVSPD